MGFDPPTPSTLPWPQQNSSFQVLASKKWLGWSMCWYCSKGQNLSKQKIAWYSCHVCWAFVLMLFIMLLNLHAWSCCTSMNHCWTVVSGLTNTPKPMFCVNLYCPRQHHLVKSALLSPRWWLAQTHSRTLYVWRLQKHYQRILWLIPTCFVLMLYMYGCTVCVYVCLF